MHGFQLLRAFCVAGFLLLLGLNSAILFAQADTSDPQAALPPGALRQWGAPITPFTGGTQSAAFCPKTGRLAMGDAHGNVRLWNANDDTEIAVLPRADGGAFAMSFSADGSRLAVAGNAGFVVYSVPEQKIIRAVTVRTRNAQNVRSLSFGITADGTKVVTVREGALLVHDVDTGKLLPDIWTGRGFVQTMALSPDGQTIAIGTLTAEVHRLRLTDGRAIGRPIRLIPEGVINRGGVMGLAYSPDGRELIVTYPINDMWAFDARTGDQLRQYEVTNPSRQITIGRRGEEQLIALLEGNGRTAIWKGTDTEPWKIIDSSLGFGITFLAASISPDGRIIASPTTTGSFDLLDLDTMQRPGNRSGHAGAVIALATSPDGRRIASLGEDRQLRVVRIDRDPALLRVRLNATTAGNSLDFQPSQIRASTSRQMRGNIFEVDLETAKVEQNPLVMVNAVGLVPGTQTAMIATSRNNQLQLWDGAQGNIISEIATLQLQPIALSITNPGRQAAVFELGAVSLWDAEQRRILRRFSTDLGNVRPVGGVIADDASIAVILGNDGKHRVIEMLTGGVEELSAINEPLSIALTARTAAFLPGNSRYLLTLQENRRLVIIDLVTQSIAFEFPELEATVTAIAFTPDRQRLLTGFDNGTTMLWALPNLAPSAPAEVTDAGLARLWDDLGDADGMKGYRAARQLAATGSDGVTLIRSQLAPAVDQTDKIASLIRELDDERFRVREQAATALIDLGPAARTQLEDLKSTGGLSEELTERIDRVLSETDRLQPETSALRQTVRALAVLQWINTPEAIAVIQEYAKGAEDAALTVEAQRGLARIRKQQ